jgi:hypothetical protein
MLPLEGIFFIPSLVVVPAALAALFFLRKREAYPWLWRRAVIVCLILCGLFALQVLNAPLYSQRDHSPDNPGGPSSGIFAVIGVFLIGTCIVIPAFPMLIALAAVPPRGWRRLPLVLVALLFVGVLGWLMVRKNGAYFADYQQAQQQGRQERIEWRQQQIRP